MAVFGSRCNALAFCKEILMLPLAIEKCLYIPSIDQEFWYIPTWNPFKRVINKGIGCTCKNLFRTNATIYGSLIQDKIGVERKYDYPKSTCFADAIMLIGEENEIPHESYVWA